MLAWMALAPAMAQVVGGEVPEINAQTFRPSIDGAGLLWADDAGRRRGPAQGRVLLQYVDDPLVYVNTNDEVTRLVTQLFQANVVGGVNLGPLRVGVDVPVYLRTGSEVLDAESGLGDIAGDLKLTLFDKPDGPIDFAVGGRVWAPTATVENALGNRQFAYEVTGIVSREFGKLLVALNLGTRGGPQVDLENVDLNDGFIGRLGLGLQTSERSGLAVEASTTLPYTEPLGTLAGTPVEVLGSGYLWPSKGSNLVLRAGAGGGVTPGIGSPDFRIIVGLGFEPREEVVGDRDGDGIIDTEDACPDEPEDFDDFEDDDGCPDPDNDKDGILDVDDNCPNTPEDFDGYEDEDGCPEGTMVSLDVVDKKTGEPLEVARIVVTPEDGPPKRYLTPFEEELPPGKYTIEVSTVGYEPYELEIVVEEGPEQEVVVELEPKEDAPVTIDRGQIQLSDTIHFELNSSAIKPESYPLLDEAVSILREYDEIEQVRIEGHTDERGADEYNQTLSEDRASSVMTYFVAAGISQDRLNAVGYGESRPIDPRSIPEAWDKNRRTDFFIEEWAPGAGSSRPSGAADGASSADEPAGEATTE